jgi:GR25 family glycosyltransferase involved in LPS biosynthesis
MDCVVITLPERILLVEKLMNDIQMPLTIFDAVSGLSYVNKYKDFKHILHSEKITEGMIGCLESHIQILKGAQYNVLIFEDDCEFVSDSNDFFIDDFDIMCLGTNENVEFELFEGKDYVRIFRFWGTHAILLRENGIQAVLKTYEKYYNQKIFLPADWLYSYAIKEHNLNAYAPINPKRFFKQKSGLVSSVNGRIRT